MKLLQSPTSPYARKVRIVIIEKELGERVQLETANPAGPEAERLRRANPLGKVPCLILDSGAALYDSPVICEYLDGVSSAHPLIPASGAARWTVLRLQALADGIMDAAVNTRMEAFRREGERSADMVEHWRGGIVRGLEHLGQEPHLDAPGFDLGHIAVAAALGYLDFRFPDIMRVSPPANLKSWWENIQKRPSVRETAPPV
jgi:glutathione S-transferase